MSDGILSDLIGERVQVLPESSIYLPFEGVVRGILATLALIIEDNNGRISVRSFENNTFTRIEAAARSAVRVLPNTVRSVKVGDTFKFKKPPPGWTSGNLLVVDKMPGWAAPEGWDYFPIELLDSEIEPAHWVGLHRADGDDPFHRWQPIYEHADVEQCASCVMQRRKAGNEYQYREGSRGDWHS